MKLTRGNIYVPLEGKSEEELTDLYNFLESVGEKIYDSLESGLRDIWRYKCYEFYEGTWCLSNDTNKQEVTIQQLKEILQPMENTKFKKDDVIIITDFGSLEPKSFTLNKPYKLKEDFIKGKTAFIVYEDDKGNIGNGYFIKSAKKLTIELHKEPTLTEQLEKAEAEVKRLKEAIEEESKPKEITINISKFDIEHLIKIRNYYGENDKTTFEHASYDVINRIIKQINKQTK